MLTTRQTNRESFGTVGKYSEYNSNVTSGKGPTEWSSVLLERGQSATATYTNLQGTYYPREKVSKIVYTYTLDPSSKFHVNDKAWLGNFKDLTMGFSLRLILVIQKMLPLSSLRLSFNSMMKMVKLLILTRP